MVSYLLIEHLGLVYCCLDVAYYVNLKVYFPLTPYSANKGGGFMYQVLPVKDTPYVLTATGGETSYVALTPEYREVSISGTITVTPLIIKYSSSNGWYIKNKIKK